MSDMRILNLHLTASDTHTHITHTVIVADGRMLIVRCKSQGQRPLELACSGGLKNVKVSTPLSPSSRPIQQ